MTSPSAQQSGPRWYADWRVWFCLAVLILFGILERVVGLPFRVLDWIWNLF